MRFISRIMMNIPALTYLASANGFCSNANLNFDVYHLKQRPVHYQGKDGLLWSPTAYTLIYSAHEAVLVDTPTLAEDGADLASWIAKTAPGRELKYIYITHAHADHFNAYPAILEKFPKARVVTTQGALDDMPSQYEGVFWTSFWTGLFPSIVKPDLSLVKKLPEDGKFYLEQGKHEFRSIPVVGGDTHDSTVLHVPELGLVVGGDVVYGRCYQYIAENPTPGGREKWLESLKTVDALQPQFVVPSHSQDGEDFGPWHTADTRRYIETWEEFLKKASTWQELEDLTKEAYPDRVGTLILRYTAQSFFNATF